MANGKVGHAGPAKSAYSLAYLPGDIITVELVTMPQKVSLRFHRNGTALGEAYALPKGNRYAAAASLYAANDAILALKTAMTLQLRDLPPIPFRDEDGAIVKHLNNPSGGKVAVVNRGASPRLLSSSLSKWCFSHLCADFDLNSATCLGATCRRVFCSEPKPRIQQDLRACQSNELA